MKIKKFSRLLLLAACAAILFPLAAMAADTQLVTATGYGMSVDEAKRAGVRAAVESVVGTMVDAETLIENDQLVQDKILSYSAGMVEDVKIIGVPKKNSAGLVRVRVQVKVKKTQLAERVKATIKTSLKIDGESLYQKVAFNQQNLNDAGAIMESLFSPERMQGLLKFEPDMDKGNPIDVDMTTGEVTVAIKGGVDMAAYKQWTDEIIEKLGPMAKMKVTGKALIDHSYYGYMEEPMIYRDEGLRILRSARSMEVVVLAFDNIMQALLDKRRYPCEHCDWSISVSLLDRMGDTIKSADVPLGEGLLFESKRAYGTILFPGYEELYHVDRAGRFSPGRISLGRLQTQDLREIDSVTVEVRVRPSYYNPYDDED